MAEPVTGHYHEDEEHPAYERKCLDEILALTGIFPHIDAVVDDGSESPAVSAP